MFDVLLGVGVGGFCTDGQCIDQASISFLVPPTKFEWRTPRVGGLAIMGSASGAGGAGTVNC